MSKANVVAPEDVSIEEHEGAVGHPQCLPRAGQLPGRGLAVPDDRRDGEAGGGAYGGGPYERRPRRLVSNPENVKRVIEKKVKDTEGQISAKRLPPVVRAAGYRGSARNLRRAEQEAKACWRRQRRRYRPWVPVPGQHWSSTGRRCRAGEVLRGAGLVAIPVGQVRPRPAPGDDAAAAGRVPGGAGRGAGGGAQRPDVVPAGGHRGQPGGAAPRVRPLRRPPRVPARLL